MRLPDGYFVGISHGAVLTGKTHKLLRHNSLQCKNLQTKFHATQNDFQLNEERRKLVEATRIRLQKQRERVMEYTDAKLKRN